MTAQLIDGKAFAAAIRSRVRTAANKLPRRIRLATILVGSDPASGVYVNNKIKACADVGIGVHVERMPDNTNPGVLGSLIDQLNRDPTINGILLQLPLPAHLDSNAFTARIDPRKDVDGLTPQNAGLLAQGRPGGFIPCTPRGCMQLLRSADKTLFAKQALVIGRSQLVGRPMASLLLAADCTVTIAHSKTHDLPLIAKQADIIIAAAGQPGLVKREWVKDGAIIIDVGITRTDSGELTGDVARDARDKAAFVTPVPGGVGPMTIANLLANTVIAAYLQLGQTPPPELLI